MPDPTPEKGAAEPSKEAKATKPVLDMPPPPSVYPKLLDIRKRKDLKLNPQAMGLTGCHMNPAFTPRYYQIIGVMHMLMVKRMILGDATGIGKCVTGDTLLYTHNGYVPILDLFQGLNLEPDTFQPPSDPMFIHTDGEWRPVKHLYYGGRKSIRRIRTRYNFCLGGSLVHPIKVMTTEGIRFKTLGELEIGDAVAIERSFSEIPEPIVGFAGPNGIAPNAKSYNMATRLDYRWGKLLGYLVGEGSTSQASHMKVTQYDVEINQDMRSLITDLLGCRITLSEDGKTLQFTSSRINQILYGMGVDPVTARYKRVPNAVLQGDTDVIIGFLQAMYEGEASVLKSGSIEFSTASERMARELPLLLLRFGIIPQTVPIYNKKYDHTYWRINITGSDVEIFANKIGFLSERKRSLLLNILNKARNTNVDLIPGASNLIKKFRNQLNEVWPARVGHPGQGFKYRYGHTMHSKISHIINGTRQLSYDTLDLILKIADDFGLAVPELRELRTRHYFFDPIISIEEDEEEVFDVEVDDPSHTFSANGFINHNTCQTIWTYSILKESEKLKMIVLAPKSALFQWKEEIEGYYENGELVREGFAKDVKAHVLANKFKIPGQRQLTSTAAREEQYRWTFSNEPDAPDVLIMHYGLLWRDKDLLAKYAKDYMVVFDEVTAVKSKKSKTHRVARMLSLAANRCYGLTATLLKNNLLEGYGIYNVIMPGQSVDVNGLFGRIGRFENAFCVKRMKFIPGLGRKIPQVVDYKNIPAFREAIDPYFLGRYKHEVSNELPDLTTKDVRVEMNDAQRRKYDEALSGLLEMADGDFQETTVLSQLSYCQQIVNSPETLGYDIPSAKEEEFFRMLSEDFGFHFKNDADGIASADTQPDKVIVFTMYKRLIDKLQKDLEDRGVNVCRITGDESSEQRNRYKHLFSNSPDHNIILINSAGSESINLQAANVIVFFDIPWSWGDYLQILGRMIRIGSRYEKVLAVHLMAQKSIDGQKLSMLRKKKNLIDAAMGEAQLDALTFQKGNSIRDLFLAIQRESLNGS